MELNISSSAARPVLTMRNTLMAIGLGAATVGALTLVAKGFRFQRAPGYPISAALVVGGSVTAGLSHLLCSKVTGARGSSSKPACPGLSEVELANVQKILARHVSLDLKLAADVDWNMISQHKRGLPIVTAFLGLSSLDQCDARVEIYRSAAEENGSSYSPAKGRFFCTFEGVGLFSLDLCNEKAVAVGKEGDQLELWFDKGTAGILADHFNRLVKASGLRFNELPAFFDRVRASKSQ